MFKVQAITEWSWVGICFCGEGEERPASRQHALRISWVAVGEIVTLLRVVRGGTAFQGTKELTVTTELPCSLAYEQRCLLRAANLDTGFLLHFTINSKPLPVLVIALLGQTNTSHSKATPFPRGSVQVPATLGPLNLEF